MRRSACQGRARKISSIRRSRAYASRSSSVRPGLARDERRSEGSWNTPTRRMSASCWARSRSRKRAQVRSWPQTIATWRAQSCLIAERLPETAGGDAVEHGEEAAPQNEPGQDRTLHLAPGGLRRPGEKDEDGERRREARDQLAQRRAERLQFPEPDVRDQDAEQDEDGPDEAPDDRIEAPIACAVRASGRELDEGPEQPQSGAVARRAPDR